ncbi:unnamed protein product [Effrenium voratum]|uniref:Arf-GAP domain-containing protein n=1 Tax=Effrenium voratum TaxID=2562239 RepID=A0AA36MU01_9DINO|nr:unnamed protein product [Effrenium voratum]
MPLLSLAEPLSSSEGPAWRNRSRARLISLELQDFKSFQRRSFRLDGQSLFCLVGGNSSGKSAVLDALRFVLQRRCDRSLRSYIRRGKPMPKAARVTATFARDEGGPILMVREVRVHPDSSNKEGYILSHWVKEEEDFKELSPEGYVAYLAALQCLGGDLLLPQFGLLDGRAAAGVLQMLPKEIERVGLEGATSAPLLKRKNAKTADRSSAAGAMRAEAWLVRRVDEVYRELTREPLDDRMEEWGEGGQAVLSRQADGCFELRTSARRGGVACGCGTPLNSLSDGARDICALSLLFALLGLLNGMREALAPFVVLDEPDSRLDKRHASALRRFLQGRDGPRQCIWMSLNNHNALPGDIVLDGDEDVGEAPDEMGEKVAHGKSPSGKHSIKARFLSQMSARLREEDSNSKRVFFMNVWASVSHGIYISIEASGKHRSLGVKTSFVQSLYLDAWKPIHLKMMELGGNERFHRFMEQQGVPKDLPITQKYRTRAAEWYREALRAEAEGSPAPEPLEPGTGHLSPERPGEPALTAREDSDSSNEEEVSPRKCLSGLLALLGRTSPKSASQREREKLGLQGLVSLFSKRKRPVKMRARAPMSTVKLNRRVTDKVRELQKAGLPGLRLPAVAKKLSELEVDSALEVLQVVQDADTGDDPNKFLLNAIEGLQNPMEEVEAEEPAEEPAEEGGYEEIEHEDVSQLLESVKQRVLKLNKTGKLCTDVDLSKVGGPLAKLTEPIAMQLLKDIDSNADMVDKPTNLIADAARKIFESGRGAASEKAAQQFGVLMRRIRWVNSNVSLQYPLHMGNVLDILQPLKHEDALQVLKDLVTNAEEIDSPQMTWLRKAARALLDGYPDGGDGGGDQWKSKDWKKEDDWKQKSWKSDEWKGGGGWKKEQSWDQQAKKQRTEAKW